MDKSKVFTLGLAGGTGSGKSSIVNKIVECFPNEVTVLSMDNYYKAHDNMSYEDRCKINFDCPDSFDSELFIEHVNKLQDWEPIDSPIYDFTVHNRSQGTETVVPNKILLVDGIFALVFPELTQLMDTKLYVSVDPDVRILRRALRDIEDRGRTLESVIDQYLTTVKPMHEKYIGPSKKNADLIIPQGAFNTVAMDIVIDHLKGALDED